MKIAGNITIYAGANVQGTGNVEKSTEQTGEQNSKSVYAGKLNDNLLHNDIAQRKKEAQEKAMQVVGDAFEGDLVIDEDLENRRTHISQLREETKELWGNIKGIREQRDKLKAEYDVAEGEEGPQEYQDRMRELAKQEQAYQEKVDDNNQVVLEESAIIRGTRMERLKHAPMLKAQKQAEEILEDASEEVINMVVENAKEHIDTEAQEREEKAEKLEEEREKKEAFIERQQEKQKEQEELLEELPMEEMLSMERTKTDIQKEVQQIVDKMKLVAEDIKGAVVDQNL